MNKSNLKKFGYLLNLQISRDLKITIGSAIAIMVLNIAYFSYSLNSELQPYLEKTNNLGAVQMFDKFRRFSSLNSSYTVDRMVLFLILGCFCLYCWYLWLGEFKGENKSAYTLLTLPLPKKFMILYKFLAACFYYISLIFFQILGVFINYFIFKTMVPEDAIVKEGLLTIIISSIGKFDGFIPLNWADIITKGLFFIALILLAFLFAILERSFGIKGGVLGFIFGCSFIFCIAFLPGMMNFYAFERSIWSALISIVYILVGWFSSKYLLENKIHV